MSRLIRWTLAVCVLLSLSSVHAFEVETLAGERVNLSKHTQSSAWTLVFLWSLDCPACEAQKPEINRFALERADHNVQVVGLALDGVAYRDQIEERVTGSQPVYPNYMVLADVFAQQFAESTGRGYRGLTPTFVLYRPGGELVGVHPGPVNLDDVRRATASPQ